MDAHQLRNCPLCRAPLETSESSDVEEETSEDSEEETTPPRRPAWAVDPPDDVLTEDDLVAGEHEFRHPSIRVYSGGHNMHMNKYHLSYFFNLLRFGHRPENIYVYTARTVPDGSFWRIVAGLHSIDRLVDAFEYEINIEEGDLGFIAPILEKLHRLEKMPSRVVACIRYRGNEHTSDAFRALIEYLQLPLVHPSLEYVRLTWLTDDDADFEAVRIRLQSIRARGIRTDIVADAEDGSVEITATATESGIWRRFMEWVS